MHDKPGVIIVSLLDTPEAIKKNLEDALAQGEFLFATNMYAVFAKGYLK